MKWKKTGQVYVVRLERGEELLSTLTRFVREQDIRAGMVQGLGAIRDLVLGIYDPHKKEYCKKAFEDDLELGNLTGNISYFEGNPILHCHVTAAATDLRACTGHLFSAVVAVTAECVITPFPDQISRVRDEEIGLNLLDV